MFQDTYLAIMLKPIVFGLLFYLATLINVNGQIIKSTFSCDGRVSGYYADVGTGCQAYHMCDGLGRKFSFSCPNATLFQQRMLICDHWFMVNCSKSESEYGANLLIGQKGKPFVEDSGQSSFQRTPRPDYTNGKSEKHNAIYQNKVDPSDDFNQVNEENQNNLPSRWSTEYNKIAATENPNNHFSRRQDIGKRQRTRQSTPTPIDRLNNYNTQPDTNGDIYTSAEITNRIPVNFESRFKATTPVYPQFVNDSLKLNDLDLAPPRPQSIAANIEDFNNPPHSNFKQTEQKFVQVNFESNYKATTPVYPTFVDEELKMKDIELSPPAQQRVTNKVSDNYDVSSKENAVQVNFESNYKATTPVYPTFVDEALKGNNFELSPPAFQANNNDAVINRNNNPSSEETSSVKVNFPSNFKATTPVYPTFVDDSLKTNNFELFSSISQTGGEFKGQEDVKINFESNFKATTPVYPLSVESTSPIPDEIGLLPPLREILKQQQPVVEVTTRIPINFESNFLATVPNYPLSVEATSPSPDDVGLLPPIRNDPSGRFLSFEPKDIDQENSSTSNKDTREPSQYYEPPLFHTGYVDPNGALASYRSNSEHVLAPKVDNWNELKKRFSVPDYDFPLDSAAQRGSYDSELSSFQPRPGGFQKR